MCDHRHGDALPPLPARCRLFREFRLLAACTWIAPAPQVPTQAERIAAICGEGIDWNVFLSLIERHRTLAPYDVMRRALGNRFPIRVYELLKARRYEACKLALVQTAEIVRINNAFRAHGIDILPMKGMMLSLQLYGDPAMRSARDIDFLIKPKQLAKADEVLRKEGYRRILPECQLTPKREHWLLQHYAHFDYFHNERRHLIELHWRLLLWKVEHVAELWNHCRPANWMGTSFLNLNDDALLLFLCDHGARHCWSRIKWLNDVASLVTQERSFSWETILTLAYRFDLTLAMAQSGMLLHWLYGISLPQPWLALVASEKRSGPLAIRALDAMHKSEREQSTIPALIKTIVYPARVRNGLPVSALLASRLLSATEFKEFPLPDCLFWLYFPLRPLLWFYHHYIKGSTLPTLKS